MRRLLAAVACDARLQYRNGFYAAAGFVNHNSFWHSTIMTQKALTDAEIIDYADHHSGTMGTRPGVLNPYKVGIELFRDIEERWNKGKFGKEWDECENLDAKRTWDKKLNRGREVEKGVDYTVIQTRFDETVVPYTSAFLDGPRAQLTNVLLQRACPGNIASHPSVAFDPVVFQWIRNALRRDGPADPRFRPRCG